MIDDKIVHKGLKIRSFLNPSLLGVELGISKICGLKKFKFEYLKFEKRNSSEIFHTIRTQYMNIENK